MIIPVKKKRFTNAGNIDAKLIDFSEIWQKKTQRKRLFYTDCFLAKVPPRNFPWNQLIFQRICPWKSFENWLFSAKIPRNGPIFVRILTFLLRKSPEIGRLFHKFWLFSLENPAKSADFSANLPLKIPQNFAFFSAKYQKPCPYRMLSRRQVTFPFCCSISLLSASCVNGVPKGSRSLTVGSPFFLFEGSLNQMECYLPLTPSVVPDLCYSYSPLSDFKASKHISLADARQLFSVECIRWFLSIPHILFPYLPL